MPAYTRPETQAIGNWSGQPATDAVDAMTMTGPGVVPAGAWWRSFGSPEADALTEQSLRSNYNLQAAIARLQQARATVEIDAAAFYPLATLGGTQSTNSGLKNTRTHEVLAQASYELNLWGKNRAKADSAVALATAAAFDADAVATTLAGVVLN